MRDSWPGRNYAWNNMFRSMPPRVRNSFFLVWALAVWAAAGSLSAECDTAGEEARYLWSTYRLRLVSTVENRLQQIQRLVLLKLDTATGRVWQYNPESLTVDSEGVKGPFGHFVPIEVEGLPETTPVVAREKSSADVKGGRSAGRIKGRYGFVTIAVPRTVYDLVGDKAGVVERDELFLTDRQTGHTWVFDSRVETVKRENLETRTTRNVFTRVFNSDELAVVAEPAQAPPPAPHYQLLKPLAEWKEFFWENRSGKNLPLESKPKVDCVLVLNREDSVPPLVVYRTSLHKAKVVGVTPWQMELYSDVAVDYLCNQTPTDPEKADRYLIFINTAARTAKGFNALPHAAMTGLPEQDKISTLIRIP